MKQAPMTPAATGSVEDRIAALEARARAIDDERAILDLMTRYPHDTDLPDIEDWLTLFVPQSTLSFRPAPGMDLRFRVTGHADLRVWFENHARAVPPGKENHFLINPRISVDGDTATAHSYYFVVRDEDSVLTVLGSGRWHDRFVRTPDGWRIAERQVEGDQPRKPGPSKVPWPPPAQ
jgi:3-phenylpropionate/cinnamic acid dioxygenase small subunit